MLHLIMNNKKGHMTNTLTDKEVETLIDLFDRIKLDLSDTGLPTRTNRLEAVENMKKVIEIHGYDISEQFNNNKAT